MAKANFVLPDGTKVDIDGTAEEVTKLLAAFSSPPAASGRKQSSKRKKRAKSRTTKKKPGRKPGSTSRSAQVRKLLKTKMSAAAIAKKVGCTVGLVYNVKSTSGKAKKRGPGRPRKSAARTDLSSLAGILAAVKNSDRERAQMRAALERIQALVSDALA